MCVCLSVYLWVSVFVYLSACVCLSVCLCVSDMSVFLCVGLSMRVIFEATVIVASLLLINACEPL